MNTKCLQCGTAMSAIEAIMGAVCGSCCRKNQAEVTK